MLLFLALLSLAQPSNEPSKSTPSATEPPLLVQMDWQGHPAMHLAWPLFFSRGLKERTPKRRWRHQFKQVVHAPYLRESGTRLFLAAAMAAERVPTARRSQKRVKQESSRKAERRYQKAKRLVLSQLAYVEAFVQSDPEHFALATTPKRARELLVHTNKMVIIHSIEGAHHLLDHEGDAQFWADQGVALVTLIHLKDDELGSSALFSDAKRYITNLNGVRLRRQGQHRGLTEGGKRAIVELDQAGILVDFSHMSKQTVSDALKITEELQIAPIFTHGKLARVTNTNHGVSDEQFLSVYSQGGVFSFGLAGQHLDAQNLPQMPDVCSGSIESFQYHYEQAQLLLSENAEAIWGSNRDAQAQIEMTIGWSSDFNGWTSHSRPGYRGGKGCKSRKEAKFEVDRRGLAHPGLLPSHWRRFEEDGGDLQPMLRSAERFLQLWQRARERPGARSPLHLHREPNSEGTL